MLTTKEMKQILVDKLKAENTYFTLKDIHMTKQGNNYKVFIADYESIIFIIKFSIDREDGEEITLWRQFKNDKQKKLLLLEESHSDETIKTVLLYLGYYIGTRF